MSGMKQDIGFRGRLVADNIKAVRTAKSITYAELSRRLEKLRHRIPPLGLRRIERHERRVDIDDLFYIAEALGLDYTHLADQHISNEGPQLTYRSAVPF